MRDAIEWGTFCVRTEADRDPARIKGTVYLSPYSSEFTMYETPKTRPQLLVGKSLISIILLIIILPVLGYSQIKPIDPEVNDAEIDPLLFLLRSSKGDLAEQVATQITMIAEQGPEKRAQVLASLDRATDNLDEGKGVVVLSVEKFRLWENVNIVYRKLVAIEAIDKIISCMVCSNGTVGSQPATGTLLFLGRSKYRTEVVAKLGNTLNSEYGIIRAFGAATLGDLRCEDVCALLENALRSKPDEAFRLHLTKALDRARKNN